MIKLILTSICFIGLTVQLLAQGCSDAGFCSIGSIELSSVDSSSSAKNKISILLNNGIGDEGVFASSPGLQYDLKMNSNLSLEAKLTANYAIGNLGTASGLGDVFLSGTYFIKPESKSKNAITLGVKIPLDSGDLKSNGKPLPMQYQSSLGTTDLILGYGYRINKMSLNVAFQLPLTENNQNSFLPEIINTPEAFNYVPSNKFKRNPDALFRFGYQLKSKNKLELLSSILFIYHLGQDSYINKKISSERIEIIGSEGLTINLTASLSYKLKNSFSIGITGGFPLLIREIRPDGLTRAFSISPSLYFNF